MIRNGPRIRDKNIYPADFGGPGGGDGLEARIARLEVSVSHIESDVRDIKTDLRDLRNKVDSHLVLLFGALIATAVGLAGLMAKGFGWL